MIAQGPCEAWPRRLDAIVADGHPIPDLKYFEVQPPALPLGGSTFKIFAVRCSSHMSLISVWGHMS